MNRTAGQGITDDAIRIEMEPLRPRTQQAAVAQLGQAALDGMSLEGVFALALDLVCAALDVEFAKVLEHPAPDRPMVIAAVTEMTNTSRTVKLKRFIIFVSFSI